MSWQRKAFAGAADEANGPGKTYGDLATPASIEQRLSGGSAGPGYLNPKAFCPASKIGDGTGFGRRRQPTRMENNFSPESLHAAMNMKKAAGR